MTIEKEILMRPLLVAYSLIGSFFVVERLLRQGESAMSLQEGPADRGSTRAIGSAFGLALLALLVAPLLNRLQLGRFLSETSAWGGIAVMLSGLTLRLWAIRVLGAFYTRTLRTDTGQHLIDEGPYRLIRHPGYLANILMWLGAGVATSNGIVTAMIILPLVRAYQYRMRAEEAMLADTFPQEYPSYVQRTWRLIPFIY
jgi:protein-S-isoprenylcysteine O-methyltransferase Ste14